MTLEQCLGQASWKKLLGFGQQCLTRQAAFRQNAWLLLLIPEGLCQIHPIRQPALTLQVSQWPTTSGSSASPEGLRGHR